MSCASSGARARVLSRFSFLAPFLALPVLAALATACSSSASSSSFGPGDGGASGSSNGDATLPPLTGSDGGTSGEAGGCTNLQCAVQACSGGTPTTITGRVLDPIGHNPLNGVAVYVPNSAVSPLPRGASCDTCSSLFTGNPVASGITGPDGRYTISNAPNGTSIPLVVQVGKWRKQTTAATVTPCTANAQPDITLPKNGSEGDMPDIAVSTGMLDSLECLLTRIGIDASEYVAGNATTGHVHIFQGGEPGSQGDTLGACGGAMGTSIGGAETGLMPNEPASYQALWDSTTDLMAYDMVLLSCEGGETYKPNLQALHDYTSGGGRVFASHFQYAWFNAGPFASENLADWQPGECGDATEVNGNVVVTQASGQPYPKGQAFQQWLSNVGALTGGTLPVYSAKDNAQVTAANTPSQSWITAGSLSNAPGTSLYFSFDTPTNAATPADGGSPAYCGRVVYSGMHVAGAPTTMDDTTLPPPTGCKATTLSAQEAALEFMLFDLSSCVTPDGAPPANPIPIK